VVYMYVHIRGIADRGIPPPSSAIFMVISYHQAVYGGCTSSPSATSIRMGGKWSAAGPCFSTTARKAFFKTSKHIWLKCLLPQTHRSNSSLQKGVGLGRGRRGKGKGSYPGTYINSKSGRQIN
jgi:hypothetical protein